MHRRRGFGFVWFKDKIGMEDAMADMHNKELEGRKISVTRAVPMSETKPGTPAGQLGGGEGARTREISRPYPREHYGRDSRGGGGYGGGDRGYDRGYDRGGYGSYDRSSYDRGYDRGGYGGSYSDRGGYDSRGYG